MRGGGGKDHLTSSPVHGPHRETVPTDGRPERMRPPVPDERGKQAAFLTNAARHPETKNRVVPRLSPRVWVNLERIMGLNVEIEDVTGENPGEHTGTEVLGLK